ncbi:MAG: pectin acetylesterase-family hydrolase [Myxococcales bacterium]
MKSLRETFSPLLFASRTGMMSLVLLLAGCGSPEDEGLIEDSVNGEQQAVLSPCPGGSSYTCHEAGNQWNYITGFGNQVKCLDGTGYDSTDPTNNLGLGFRPSTSSPNLVVYMDGGGVCFNRPSCEKLANQNFSLAKFTSADPAQYESHLGIFDNARTMDNPVAGWSQVFIPYCTGDFHAGQNEVVGLEPKDASGNTIWDTANDAAHTKPLHFVGYKNATTFFTYIVNSILPTLPTPPAGQNRRIILHGASAGGYGVMFNAKRFKAMLPSNVTLTVVDDSGPLISSNYGGGVVQQTIRTKFNYDATVLSCGSACAGTNAQNWFPVYRNYLMNNQKSIRYAFISSMSDYVIRWHLGLMNANCAQNQSASSAFSDINNCWIDQTSYYNAMLNIRSDMTAASGQTGGPKTATFFINTAVTDASDPPWNFSAEHVFTTVDRFYNAFCANLFTKPCDWYGDLSTDAATFRNLGP